MRAASGYRFAAGIAMAALAAAAIDASTAPALGGQRCMVTDPTGTPLNVRQADGTIIDTLTNGEWVEILRTGADRHGKPWAYVVAEEGEGKGWVYREFISCP